MTPRIRATYRLQLGGELTLVRAREIVPYLERLGISHLYASPLLRSRTGSEHGYDVVDPTRLDPALGTQRDLEALAAALHEHGMGILLDIVPNHMGVGSENPFWDDLFANGPASRYASWFDIDWSEEQLGVRGRVLVPILGDDIAAVIERDEIRVEIGGGRPRVRYFEHSFPLDPVTIPRVLIPALETVRTAAPADAADARELGEVLDALLTLPPRLTRSAARVEERQRRVPATLAALRELYLRSSDVRGAVDRAVRDFGQGVAGRRRLADLLAAQVYALVHWRRAAHEINYRRFFDINELVALRTGDPEVFAATHELVLRWVRHGIVDAIRVDHVDGLFDPRAYLTRLGNALRATVEPPSEAHVPLFVEKILTGDERLPPDWPVDGTTGYEFLSQLEAVFIDPAGRDAIEARYRRVVRLGPHAPGFDGVARRSKALVLRTSLGADVRRLVRLLAPIAARDRASAGITRSALREAVIQLIAAFPVYRTYIAQDGPASAADRRSIADALAKARTAAAVDERALRLLATLLRGDDERASSLSLEERRERALFVHRFQQVSGPAAAKGVEDTALYRYTPLASLCEVGSSPDRPLADAARRFDEASVERLARWPLSLNCTSTHDTKRSADVRSRLDVLSELPGDWLAAVEGWRRGMRAARGGEEGRPAPDAQTEYLLYQTLVGVWPAGGASPALRAELHERVGQYIIKAAREAKSRTSWSDPDMVFEGALASYVGELFAGRAGTLDSVERFARRVARPGSWNALARALVHCTAPGTPDIYQGDELWNFALVDPDNRRPVDFAARERLLASLENDRPPLAELVADPEDGRLKLHIIHRALARRRDRAQLFATGSYHALRATAAAGPGGDEAAGGTNPEPEGGPATAEGSGRARHVFAFARQLTPDAALVVVPRLTLSLLEDGGAPVGSELWGDARIPLPAPLRRSSWRRTIGDGEVAERDGSIALSDALAQSPVELLVSW